MTDEQADAIRELEDRKRSYQLTFEKNLPANQAVLQDLAIFCRAQESCVIPGDRDRSLLLAGRHEVWLRICEWLHMTPEELFIVKGGVVLRRKPNE